MFKRSHLVCDIKAVICDKLVGQLRQSCCHGIRPRVLMGNKVGPHCEFIAMCYLRCRRFESCTGSLVFYKLPVIFHKLVGQNLQTCCHRSQIARRDGQEVLDAWRGLHETCVACRNRHYFAATGGRHRARDRFQSTWRVCVQISDNVEPCREFIETDV